MLHGLKLLIMKSIENVYVNVLHELKLLNMKSRGQRKCLCECYMIEMIKYEVQRKC
jgi:hypothetical protein